MNDERLALGEDVLEVVLLEEGVGVVRSEALFASGAGREIPGVGRGGGSHAAEKAGELSRGAQAGVFFIDELANEDEVVG